jgi:large subunit ribosomal protein L23
MMMVMDNSNIIKFPVSTEKSMRLMESENKLVFVVDRKASKDQIAKAVKELFNVEVVKVNTHITSAGIKRAFVKLGEKTPAIDIATQLGMM